VSLQLTLDAGCEQPVLLLVMVKLLPLLVAWRCSFI
jgi:hypothetical protein